MGSVGDILRNPEFTRSTPIDEFFKRLTSQLLSRKQELKDDNINFVRLLLGYFNELHGIVLDKQIRLKKENNDMLPISLHDMRYTEELIQLIVSHGIIANLPFDFQPTSQKSREVPGIHNLNTLKWVIWQLYDLLAKDAGSDDYVRSIFLKGPLFTYTFLGILVLYRESTNSENLNYVEVLRQMEDAQDTYKLFVMYNFFLQELSNDMAKSKILSYLSTLVVRRDNGVLSLIDFVTGARESEQMDIEKMNRVTQIIVSKPKAMNSTEYFSMLFPQIFNGLSMLNETIVVSCLNNVVTALFLRNPKIVRDFLFRRVFQVIFNEPLQEHGVKELNDTINVMISLTKNSSNELILALIEGVDRRQFYLNIWIYALFLKKHQKINPLGKKKAPYYEVILTLLKTLISLLTDTEALIYLSMNLLNYQHEEWNYQIDFETQLAYITLRDNSPGLNLRNQREDPFTKVNQLFADIDESIDLFLQLLKMINKEHMIKDVFLATLHRWIKTGQHSNSPRRDFVSVESSPIVLLDLKILEKLYDEFPTEIIKEPLDILRLIDELLDSMPLESTVQQDSDDEEDKDEGEYGEIQSPDPLSLIIQLLERILSLPSTQLVESKPFLQSIERKLRKRDNFTLEDNFRKILKDISHTAYDEHNSDEKTLYEAFNNLGDSLAPIQVLGLKQLTKLVQKHSAVITAARVVQLQLPFLKNHDPYVYLNAIGCLSSLCQYDPSCIESLANCYTSVCKLDDVLKIGEVFIQYIHQEHELFQGKEADEIIDACINNVRRRGEIDDRIRMSSMSVLGVSVQVNARGIQSRLGDMLDCSFGILQMENKTKTGFIVRRAALHLIHDLMNCEKGIRTLLFPSQRDVSRLRNLLEYTKDKDDDQLVAEQARQLLSGFSA